MTWRFRVFEINCTVFVINIIIICDVLSVNFSNQSYRLYPRPHAMRLPNSNLPDDNNIIPCGFFIQMSWYAHFGEPSFSVKRLKHEIIHYGREVQVYSFTYQLWSYYYLCNTFLKNSQYSRRLQWFYGTRHAMTFRPAIVITFLVRTK